MVWAWATAFWAWFWQSDVCLVAMALLEAGQAISEVNQHHIHKAVVMVCAAVSSIMFIYL
jgi:hypothetical protein